MLSDLRVNSCSDQIPLAPVADNRYSRDMQEDMKTAIELLFKLKSGLDKLHPECTRLVEKMMALPINRY